MLIVALIDRSPIETLKALVEGSVGSKQRLAVTAARMSPLIVIALGWIVAFRAAKVNLGLQGQLLIGGLAAAAALLGFVLLSTTMPPNHPENIPSSAASQAPLALSGHDVRLDRAELTEVLRSREYSAALSDPRALNACLRAHGATVDPIAAREITLDGRPAQLFILSTGVAGKFRLLAVGSDCGAEHPATISDSTVGD